MAEDGPVGDVSGSDMRDAGDAGAKGAHRIGMGAATAARGAGRRLASGYAAVRDVRAATHEHQDARAQSKALRRELREQEALLSHRDEVESSYQQIMAEQAQALQASRSQREAVRARIEGLEAERTALDAKLSSAKARHEAQLRPYRNLSDVARGRADDAAVALAEAKRAVKAADGRLGEAVRSRDQRVQTANRAVDSAQGRLHKAQGELDRLQADPSSSPAVVDRMRSAVAAERSAVAAAKADVAQVSDEAQLAVDNAQTHLWTQRQSLDVAERQAEAAKREATERRREYDTLYRQAKDEEDRLAADIKERVRAIEEAGAEEREAAAREEAARTLMEEAEGIHATPELTAQLRGQVASGHEELVRREEREAALARQEKGLRRRTRNQRMAFLVVAVAAIMLVGLVAWLILR